MEQQQKQQINKYIDLILRRKKIIISSLMIAIFVGLAVYVKTPKIYQSSALLTMSGLRSLWATKRLQKGSR